MNKDTVDSEQEICWFLIFMMHNYKIVPTIFILIMVHNMYKLSVHKWI